MLAAWMPWKVRGGGGGDSGSGSSAGLGSSSWSRRLGRATGRQAGRATSNGQAGRQSVRHRQARAGTRRPRHSGAHPWNSSWPMRSCSDALSRSSSTATSGLSVVGGERAAVASASGASASRAASVLDRPWSARNERTSSSAVSRYEFVLVDSMCMDLRVRMCVCVCLCVLCSLVRVQPLVLARQTPPARLATATCSSDLQM
ncbi:hypothetical protein BC831DRAFT_473065, partial [Entophlyctis helioformis]